VTPEEHTLDAVLRVLERLNIPYMITGSLAASHHGRPRATHDADLVVDLDSDQLDALVRDLDAASFYVDAAAAREALAQRRQFNVIDTAHACKVDLIVRKDRAFSREEFDRRQHVDIGFGRPLAMVTPEDSILSKLEWAKRTDSERQIRDAAAIVEMNPRLDRRYVTHWAEQLGVAGLWRAVSAVDRSK
jgi:hypothetical protein